MTEIKGVGLMIFTGINALGLGFLLYALLQFWKEEHKPRRAGRSGSRRSGNHAWPKAIVAMAPKGEETRKVDRLIQFPVRSGSGQQRGETNSFADRTHNASRSAAR